LHPGIIGEGREEGEGLELPFHYAIDLKGWPRYYFYFRKLAGYVLASFLIAGLSGLTK
jgi:hypothetical protein